MYRPYAPGQEEQGVSQITHGLEVLREDLAHLPLTLKACGKV